MVGTKDEIKGLVPIALLVCTDSGNEEPERVVKEVIELVRKNVGAVAAMREAAVVAALPKTRSGKTLRNAIRSIGAHFLHFISKFPSIYMHMQNGFT